MISLLITPYSGVLDNTPDRKKMIIKRSSKNENRWSNCLLTVGLELESRVICKHMAGELEILSGPC